MESKYWPPQQMIAYQWGQLAQLLRQAKAAVPFHNSRMDAVFKKMARLTGIAGRKGRQDQLMHFPDGPVAITCLSPQLVRDSLNALTVRFAQVQPLRLEIRYTPTNSVKVLDTTSVTDCRTG
jgi:hypothetical protein